MRPRKKWGQHFLRNRGAVEKIVSAVEPAPGEIVVEIGPGEGVLTEELAKLGNEVVAVEIDPELAERIRSRFPSVEVRNEDALESVLPATPFRAVGNLPYNVGTPILRRIIADPNCRRAVFMLQKEVADRLVAKPGDEDYGYLTLYREMFADAKTLMTLSPQSFYPPPKVRSAVVVLDPKPSVYSPDLLELISVSFRMRRKKLVNNLIGWRGWSREDVLNAMSVAGIAENARAETLGLQDFEKLVNAVASP